MKKNRRIDNSTILAAATWELRFEKMRADSLLQEVREIVTMTNDPLAKKVAEMAIERYHLDSMIHTRLIFWNK